MAEILDINRPEKAEHSNRQSTKSRPPIRPSEDYLVILGQPSGQVVSTPTRKTKPTPARLPEENLVLIGRPLERTERTPEQSAESRHPDTSSEVHSNSLGQLSEQADLRRTWQSVAIGLIAAISLVTTLGTWLYIDWRTTTSASAISHEFSVKLADGLNAAARSIQSLKDDLAKVTAKVAAGETTSRTLKDSLDNTKQQLQAERERYAKLQSQMAALATLLSQSDTNSTLSSNLIARRIKYLEMESE